MSKKFYRYMLPMLIILLLAVISCKYSQEDTQDNLYLPGTQPDIQQESTLIEGGEYFNGIPPNPGTAVLAYDKNGVLWITVGIVAYHNGQYQVFDKLNTVIPDNYVREVIVDKNNNKWFGTEHGYIYTFDDHNWEILPTPAGDYRTTEKGEIRGTYRIEDILQDDYGTVWVSAWNGGVWSYKGKKIDSHFTDVFSSYVNSLAVDSEGNLLAATKKEIYRYNGQVWENITQQFLKDSAVSIYMLFYDKINSTLYIGTNHGLIMEKGGETKTLTSENSGLAFDRVSFIETDSDGNLWLAYWNGPNILTRYDGGKWTEYPGYGRHVSDLVYNGEDGTWLTSSDSGLNKFDGNSWSKLPVLDTDPRLWWKQKSLDDLSKEEIISVDIHDVLESPLAYRGKKISFIGKIETGWEYADIIDEQGVDLDIWPEYHRDLAAIPMFPKPGGHPGYNEQESKYSELIGYLEFQGYYGHLGQWPFQFYIVEVRSP